VPEPVTWYDVLGVPRGASAVTLRRAHEERLVQLRSFFTPPVPVPSAAMGAAPVPSAQTSDAPSAVVSAASRAAAAVEEAWLVLGDPEQRRRYDTQLGLRPPIPRRRRLTVPDVRGLFYRPSQAVAATAGLRLAVIRLTCDPLPVEGLVIGQSPDPGETVRRRSTLTIQVWHPARSQ
jgi:curved DNA-binding protein CbpA